MQTAISRPPRLRRLSLQPSATALPFAELVTVLTARVWKKQVARIKPVRRCCGSQ
jgi:hypothetical protein